MTKQKEIFTIAEDIIVGIATPLGKGGIGIIRISGQGSLKLAKNIFLNPKDLQSHQALFAKFIDPQTKRQLDQGLLLYLKEGSSYTGEETVELHCHGSTILLTKILEILISLGARLAEPGEFSKRAFLNGKIDLSMAQGVIEVIEANNSLSLKEGQKKLVGEFSNYLSSLREKLLDILAEVEALIDFPEDNIQQQQTIAQTDKLTKIEADLEHLIDTYHAGQLLKKGFNVVFAGRPNVGKSSLFNAMLGESRSIVTQIPGTTRDFIEKSVEWGSLPINLIDLAGFAQKTNDIAEKVGIKSSLEHIDKADIVLSIFDASAELKPLAEIEKLAVDKLIVVGNKLDLCSCHPREGGDPDQRFQETIFVSATERTNLSFLKEKIISKLKEKLSSKEDKLFNQEEFLLTALWQKEELKNCKKLISSASKLLQKRTDDPELAAAELQGAMASLDKLFGKGDNLEELLNRIFSRFCIGK